MANPSVTYTFTNGTTADGTQVSQNFTDLINSLTDGTKSLSIDALTVAGAALFNGAVTLGNAAGDTITATGTWASGSSLATTTGPGLVNPYAGTGVVYSATYTPSLTNTTNVAASTARLCHYTRVGNQVIVHGRVDIDPTGSSDTSTVLGISLPVASNFSGTDDLYGLGVGDASDATRVQMGKILGSIASDIAVYTFLARNSADVEHYFTFQYTIK